MKLKVGDLVTHDCSMPYSNTIYRVTDLDDRGNFLGQAVFRLTNNEHAYPTRKSVWYASDVFRVITQGDLVALLVRLQGLVD